MSPVIAEKKDCLDNDSTPSIDSGHRYLVLGAGCAGLSLVWHMLEAGINDPILVLEQRREYVNDRTWCYWNVEPTAFDDLADFSWCKWEVVAEGTTAKAEAGSARLPYIFLASDRFYQRVLDRIAASPNVTLLLGQQVLRVEERADAVIVRTAAATYSGERLFDSSGWRPAAGGRHSKWLQHFRGQRIRTERPVFNPSRLTLMDHRVSQKDGPHFVYLLPFSPNEALVENTYLFAASISPARHRAEIADYLAQFHGLGPRDYEVLGEEHGTIPMGGGAGVVRTDRIERIGLAGGAARSATGYAFLRIQRQCCDIARRMAAGSLKARSGTVPGGRKYRIFDAIMLAALARSPHLAPAFFTTLFQRSPAESVVRFLTERSSIRDDIWIIRSLFKWDFVRMLLRIFWRQPESEARQVIDSAPLTKALPR